METENHEQILSAMGSLEDYLAGVPEQTATFGLTEDPGSPTGYRIARDADGAAVFNPSGQPVPAGTPQQFPPGGQVPGTVAFQQPAPPQRQAQPGISPQQYEQAQREAAAERDRARQMEEAAIQLAREKLETEDALFMAGLQNMSDEEQQLALYQRYLEQMTISNEGMARRLEEIEQTQEREDQEAAKQIVAYRKTTASRLPWTIEIRDALMDLPTPERMDAHLSLLSRHGAGLRQQQFGTATPPVQHQQVIQQNAGASPAPRARNASGQFVAAAARGSTPTGTPTQGTSGGLGSFLASTPYRLGE